MPARRGSCPTGGMIEVEGAASTATRAAPAMSAAVANRWCGFLAMARSTKDRTPGGISGGSGGGGVRTWWSASSMGFSAVNGRCPMRPW
jgi:hypothetical protein